MAWRDDLRYLPIGGEIKTPSTGRLSRFLRWLWVWLNA